MTLTLGIVGPEDLVHRVAAVGAPDGSTALLPLPYRHESETVEIIEGADARVDAFLFTGVVPYTIAADAGALTRPSMYVAYDGATLLRALVELLRLGHDVTRASIDTLRRADVLETLTEAKLPTDHVSVLPYRPGLTSDDIVAFHRAARERDDCRVAITCLGSAYHRLETEMQVIRLAPSRYSIRAALQALVLTTSGRHAGDAQVTLGMIELPEPDDRLPGDLVTLGGSLAALPGGGHLVVTTRGLLEQATGQFTRMPILDRLAERHPAVHIGFGVGRTAADAETLARRALNRAASVGAVAGVVSMAEDIDIVFEPAGDDGPLPERGQDDLPLLARRVGLSPQTVVRLRELAETRPDGLTTHDVAEHLDVQQRTARRILKRLERAGLAAPTGSQQQGRTGRPPTVYRLHL
ncbi:helix-turn-helix domain-containing protein [Actinomadura atramentaria]|uniref:helix-turn-helix domain-containing protein n=1 Tax=Actinomadura atramentaria TaxID=1990 RepID=UPI0003A964F2|nr:helix-turn-helix domain-containing protein [Actinomadura atramentaria]